ncbi:acetylornithine deacetylase [Komagataeibacter sp. FNDCR2]|uniref:acetylornithine deacetylase n=1 Tax=Komagataeibacter sp. FNDCR2 TaxID=2878682 RepID=UPI001E365A64|nr:acetylornithine deacetylase [Komagataeibacter sp. FNDCR2]MCE2574149.1 acetylornithine deacetylase [Komagataeibacter sp. FNDCR2]
MTAMPSQHTLDWITRLIAHESISSRSNLALVTEVAAHFRQLGMVVDLTQNNAGTKANLFATLPGRKGALHDGLVLSGHTDVVPVAGQDWTSDPFVASIRDGKLYGRGACDMKGFLGIAIALGEEFAQKRPEYPLHYALSFDEELGCIGAPLMIRDIVARGYHPRVCLVGEPTDMTPVTAHKASRVFECRVHGRACHSASADGVNAITYAAKIINFLDGMAVAFQHENRQDPDFDPPYTTFSVGTIEGGLSTNTVPDLCDFSFQFRSLPHEDSEAIERTIRNYIDHEIVPAMRRNHPDVGVTLYRRANVPALSGRYCEAIDDIRNTLGNRQCSCVSYGTEAGLFQQVGIDALVCGPGSIMQAHKADEFISLQQLADCEEFLRNIVV